MADNKAIAEAVLTAVGGKENVTFAAHCITRLRFNLKDNSIVKDEEVKAINGVIGVNRAGSQYQVIIGPNVDQVYKELCAIGGFEAQGAIDENLDAAGDKQPFSFKNLGSTIMDYLSGSLIPAIPVMLAASIFKMLCAVLGPSMLNVLSETSELYTLFTFVGDAGFYFFPVLIGYTAARKFGLTPALGIFFGAILIHPTVINIASEGGAFHVYGIPTVLQNYSATVLPILLTVWIASYIEKYFKKVISKNGKTNRYRFDNQHYTVNIPWFLRK